VTEACRHLSSLKAKAVPKVEMQRTWVCQTWLSPAMCRTRDDPITGFCEFCKCCSFC